MTAPPAARDAADSEKATDQLDDVRDRKELRDRFDMLLQEVRVALPGVQVLSAFLLTAPFSQRFDGLDRAGRVAFATALTASMVSVVCLLGPTLLHRLGMRTARADRLTWSIRMVLAGLVSLAVALLSSLWGCRPVRVRHSHRLVAVGAGVRADPRRMDRDTGHVEPVSISQRRIFPAK